METIKTKDSKTLIPAKHFEICLIDGLLKEQINNLYPKNIVSKNKRVNYVEKFIFHLKTVHLTSLEDYCEKYLAFTWPRCSVKQEKLKYKIHGNSIIINPFLRGGVSKETSEKFKLACEKLSRDRFGSDNPMFSKNPWNKGLDNNDPRVLAASKKRIGQKHTEFSKTKQSESAKKRKIHGHSGKKHSLETKLKLREHTARLWASGRFNRTTSIHLKMRDFLSTLDLVERPTEEFQVVYYSLDFAFPEHKLAIECQGTYFHVDPRIYPNGPKDKIQRRNFGRDIAKKKFLDSLGWKVIECWETEINDDSFKELLKESLIRNKILNNEPTEN